MLKHLDNSRIWFDDLSREFTKKKKIKEALKLLYPVKNKI